MPRITQTTGSGMTQRGVVQFDLEQPGDADAQVRAAIEAFDRSSFSRLSDRLRELATPILAVAALPTDPERAYVVWPDGTWVLLDETVDLESEGDSDLLPLDQAVLRSGHEPDSSEGYAARVLRTLSQARHQLEAGHLDDAMALAFAAGELVTEAAMKGAFEPDFLRGEKVRTGGKEGSEKAHGTEADRAARRASCLEAFDTLRAQGTGIMEAYPLLAKRFGVSARTIRRWVEQRNDKA